MSKVSMRLSKALKYFGSIKAIAVAIGLNPSTVQAWAKSGVIPDKWEAKLAAMMQRPLEKQPVDRFISVDSVIARHGSVIATAEFFDVTPNTVYRWRDAGKIPEQSLAKVSI